MRHAPWPIIVAALTCGLLTGCSPNKGPATSAYLRAYEQVSADLNAQLRQLSPVNPPVQPTPPPIHARREERREYVLERRSYRNALSQYYGEFIERGHVLENIFGQAQGRIAALNGAGVDPSAIAMVAARERTLGRRRDLINEMGRWAELARQRQADEGSGKLFSDLASQVLRVIAVPDPTGIALLAAGVRGLADFESKGQADTEAVNAQANQVLATASQFQSDVIDYQTAFAQMQTAIQADYPDQDWSFLSPKPSASGQN